MRKIRHWTLPYVGSRLGEILYQRARPKDPWLTRHANRALETLLQPTDVGLEFGSGRSTLWFARRISRLTSVEHNQSWYSHVTRLISEEGIKNVTYLSRTPAKDEDNETSAYVSVAGELSDASLDFVLIDGAQRALCARATLAKLRPGGILTIDNANWFLPCRSIAPNSRSISDGPLPGVWSEVYSVISKWRVLWTSNGVSDTAIFFKPCGKMSGSSDEHFGI
ncbi:class I SAM-dependent methyltransferase [Mesorhizobium sp.]|uniref:O-methyltransferase n=1 Tax=Mesorhizobium sp. TaxID=1871066 RepID=UPI0025806949|nr:class I SAM-dependent methyltransferase [Mesorhizobium sp.]